MRYSKFFKAMNDHIKNRPMLLLMVFTMSVQLGMLAIAQEGRSAEIYVSSSGSDDAAGSFADPLRTIGQGLNFAQPGDTVFLRKGAYSEKITFPTAGTADARIVLSSYENETVIVQQTGRAMDVDKPYVTVHGLILDGGWGESDIVVVKGTGDFAILSHLEIRNGRKDGIDIWTPKGVLIDNCRIHDTICFDGDNRIDAHGIVTEGVKDLTIRNTEIYYVSGDALQFQYGGWDNIRVENCTLWNGPLPTARGGAAAGVNPGENAIDTKYEIADGRGRLHIENTVAYGWWSDIISNAAAFNIKHNVEATFQGATVYDSNIAFRLRGPGSKGGAWVTLKNVVVFDASKAVRYEDDIENLHIYNMTFGDGIEKFFESAGGYGDGFETLNCLFLSSDLPGEAADDSNLAVGADAFADVAGNNYHLAPNSPAIDAGVSVSEVSVDRDGDPRPSGKGYDVGAYEFDSSLPMFNISGQVLNASGDPIAEAAIRSGGDIVATTDGAGQYAISLESGWSGALAPEKTGFVFAPPERDFAGLSADKTDQDFVGEKVTYTISGSVRDADGGLSGVVIRSSDGDSVETDAQGAYSIPVPFGWSGVLTPEKKGFSFTPKQRSYSGVETLETGQDYSAALSHYKISGQVLDTSGRGIEGVGIFFGDEKLAATDDEGNFAFSVPSGWSGDMTPVKTGYSFTPTIQTCEDIMSDKSDIAFQGRKQTYAILGRVQDVVGSGVPDVQILSDGQRLGTTESDGSFSLELEAGWSGTLTPSKEGFDFEPPSRTVTELNGSLPGQDFTAAIKKYVISGRILTPGGNPVPEVHMSGVNGPMVVTDSTGRFSLSVNYGWDGVLTPEKKHFTFTPTNREFTDVHNNFADQNFNGISRPIGLAHAIAVLQILSGVSGPGENFDVLEWVEDGRLDLKDALYVLIHICSEPQ